MDLIQALGNKYSKEVLVLFEYFYNLEHYSNHTFELNLQSFELFNMKMF